MANYLTDDGICLRVTDFSETSQVVGVFTRRHGMVPMIAKGSKRQTKKNSMSGPLDLLTSGEVVFVPSKGAAELATLAGWELINHRNELRANLAGLNAAMLCAEVTTLLVHPHDPHENLFLELEAALALLGTPQRMRGIVAYVKAALDAAGYAAELNACLACGKTIGVEDALRFSARAGGVMCAGCLTEGGVVIPVSGRIVIALDRLPSPQALLASPPDRPADVNALRTAIEMLLAQVEAITDRALRTRYLVPSIFQ